jgi:transcriptional regulator with XRE-family HTH domain
MVIPASPNELGQQLRAWRATRGKSQLDISLDTGISQRQVSFIESGKSTPGRQNLLQIAEALDVPFRERNALLLAAGYAPIYAETTLDDQEMKGITQALNRMLRQHEPYPAVVLDRYWNVLLANDAAPNFFGHFVDMAKRPRPRNLLHLMFDPAGVRPFIIGWEETARSLLSRVFRESVGRVIDTRTRELMASLLAYPGVEEAWKLTTSVQTTPVIALSFNKDGEAFNFFSLVTTVGTAQTITTQELRVECMFPLDDETETNYRALCGQHDGQRG